MRLLCAALLAVLLPSTAAAQNSGIYIQAGPLLDSLFTSGTDGISLSGVIGSNVSYVWNDLNGDRIWQPGEEGPAVPPRLTTIETRTLSQARFAPGASVAVGVFVTPSVSLRLEGSFQGEHVTSTDSSPLTLLAPTEIRRAAATTDLFVSAGWHQGGSRRVTIAYLAGMVFRRQQEDTTLLYRSLFVRPTQAPFPLEFEETFGSTTYSAGVMAGLDVAWNLSQHFAIVPQVRLVAANHAWSVRPGVALRWRP